MDITKVVDLEFVCVKLFDFGFSKNEVKILHKYAHEEKM